MPLIDMIGTEFQSKKYDQPLIVRNDPRDSEFMRRWWAFKEWAIDCNSKFTQFTKTQTILKQILRCNGV